MSARTRETKKNEGSSNDRAKKSIATGHGGRGDSKTKSSRVCGTGESFQSDLTEAHEMLQSGCSGYQLNGGRSRTREGTWQLVVLFACVLFRVTTKPFLLLFSVPPHGSLCDALMMLAVS